MAKLMIAIGDENYRLLSLEARVRGITVQELLRAVIVPDWVRFSNIPRIPIQNGQDQSRGIVKEENPINILSRRRP
jgi:hypothetical protein